VVGIAADIPLWAAGHSIRFTGSFVAGRIHSLAGLLQTGCEKINAPTLGALVAVPIHAGANFVTRTGMSAGLAVSAVGTGMNLGSTNGFTGLVVSGGRQVLQAPVSVSLNLVTDIAVLCRDTAVGVYAVARGAAMRREKVESVSARQSANQE